MATWGLIEQIEGKIRVIVALISSKAKRLTAKAAAMLPEIKKAPNSGRMIISGGTSNAYIIEELLDITFPKQIHVCGVVSSGGMSAFLNHSSNKLLLWW